MVAKCHRYQKPRGVRRMNRRDFLGAILAAASAPAIVRADSLMRVIPRDTGVLTLAQVREIADLMRERCIPGPYVAFVHPDAGREIMEGADGQRLTMRRGEIVHLDSQFRIITR